MGLSRAERSKLIRRLERKASDLRFDRETRETLARRARNLRKVQKYLDAKTARNRTPETLKRLFDQTAATLPRHCKNELSHRHMIALAELYESWVFDRRLSPEQTTSLLGMAEATRRLADEVGPDWDPPPPEKLSVLGYLGRLACDEVSERLISCSLRQN